MYWIPMSSNMKERRSKLLQHVTEIGCDGVAVFQPENVFTLLNSGEKQLPFVLSMTMLKLK